MRRHSIRQLRWNNKFESRCLTRPGIAPREGHDLLPAVDWFVEGSLALLEVLATRAAIRGPTPGMVSRRRLSSLGWSAREEFYLFLLRYAFTKEIIATASCAANSAQNVQKRVWWVMAFPSSRSVILQF
jgi:hypothetical protein